MWASAAALAAAVLAGYPALVALTGSVLAVAVVTKLWSRLCLKGVSCERSLSGHRVFPGEEVSLTLRVMNRKILPLPWIEVRDELPEGLEAQGRVTLSRRTPLLWYSAASFTHTLVPNARGYYRLGPLRVMSGDIFGLEPRVRTQPEVDHLIVYPRTYALADLDLGSPSLVGDVRSKLHTFDDPSRIAGVRDYEPGDSPRRIHWKVSARSTDLKVKLLESTTDLKVAVFLAMDSFEGLAEDDIELAISTAASVARDLTERDIQTGLFVNTKSADTQSAVSIMPSAGVASLAVMLEALAKTTYQSSMAFVDFFDLQRRQLGFGGTVVFVVGKVSPEVRLLQADMARAGRDVLGYCLAGYCGEVGGHSSSWRRIGRPGGTVAQRSAHGGAQSNRPEAGAA